MTPAIFYHTVGFALIWAPPDSVTFSGGPFEFSFRTSVEGKLASDESEAEDAWRFRASLLADTESTFTTFSFKDEGDRDFKTHKMIFETVFTPTARRLAIGKGKPEAELDPTTGRAKKLPPVQFLWSPFFGFEAGKTLRRGDSDEAKDTVLRLRYRTRAQVLLNFLSDALGTDETSLYLDDSYYRMPLEDRRRDRNFLKTGLEFMVNEHVGLGFEYKSGEEAPKFRRIKTLGGTIGIRFGDK